MRAAFCPVYEEGTALLREVILFASERPDLKNKLAGAFLHGYMQRNHHALTCSTCVDREIAAILGNESDRQ